MEPDSPQSGFRFEDPYQREVYEKLSRHVSPGVARFWEDACALMKQEPKLGSTTHLVAHLLREIESALRDVLLEPSRDYFVEGSGRKRHEPEVRAILKGLGISEDNSAARLWLTLADDKSETTLSKYTHRPGLEQPRPVDDRFVRFFGEMTGFFGYVLRCFENNWLMVFSKVLDRLLDHDEPTRDDIATLKDKVPQNAVALGYFFSRLNSAKWIEPLTDTGFFASPPMPVSEGDLVRFPPWPPGPYLVRMAVVDAEAVTSVIRALPETENYVVHWHVLDAALAMPASCAAEIADQVRRAVRSRHSLGIGQEARKLVEQLVEGREVDAALGIAEAMLDLSGDDEEKKRAIKGYDTQVRHEYEEALRAFAPMLAKAAGVRWVRFLAHCLTDAIRLDREGESESREDGSSVWCRAIEQNEHPVHGPKVLLLSALRQAAEAVIRERPEEASQVFEAVREGCYKIFGRLELHLLRLFPEGREKRIREILSSREEYEQCSHEYRMLLAEHFRHQPDENQRQYLA
ncbi:MAG TPA: hypothetical protein VNA25_01765, partial [Phycisphaerae bacterium]|nr:hypothetical protein [Phycisphaerae bacterium]